MEEDKLNTWIGIMEEHNFVCSEATLTTLLSRKNKRVGCSTLKKVRESVPYKLNVNIV